MFTSGLSVNRPFPGLRPFGFEDRAYFFGRDDQIYALYGLLDVSQFVAVVGSSGSGKSSLVRAGLHGVLDHETADIESSMSKFETYEKGGRRWRWCEMRPGDAPLSRLSEALAGLDAPRGGQEDPIQRAARRERFDAALRRSSLGLAEATQSSRSNDGRSVLLLVDQFEELFRYDMRGPSHIGLQEERAHFVQLLLEASNRLDGDVHVLITMRSDFIGDCAQFSGLPEAVSGCQFLVPSLARDQREEVILRPLDEDHANSMIEPALVERLLNDTGSDLDELPVLQHCLSRLWEIAGPSQQIPPRRQLREEHYSAIRGIAGALSQHADEVLGSLASDKYVVKRVFQSLTDTDPLGRTVRRPQRLAELVAVQVPDEASDNERASVEEAIKRVVTRFVDPSCSFLRLPEDQELSATTVVDIGHEALIRRWDKLSALPREDGIHVENWVRDEQNDAEELRALIYSAMIPKEQLANKERWWRERRPNRFWASRHHREGAVRLANAEAVLRRSRHEISRRWWERVVAVAMLVLVIVGGIVFKVMSDRNAAESIEKERQDVGANYLASSGESLLLRDSATVALVSAYRALKRHDANFSPAVEGLIYSSLQRLYEKTIITTDEPFTAAAFLPDGRLLTLTTKFRVWDSNTGARLPASSNSVLKRGFYDLKVSSNGRYVLASGFQDSYLLDADGNAKSFPREERNAAVGFAVFSPDGDSILTGSRNASPRLWNTTDITAPVFDLSTVEPKIKGGSAAMAFGKRYLAIADARGENICILEVNPRSPRSCIDLNTLGIGQLALYLEFNPVHPEKLLVITPSRASILSIHADEAPDVEPVLTPSGAIYFRGAFSPDGNWLALHLSNGPADVWNFGSLDEPPIRLRGPSGFGQIAFSNDDRLAIVGEEGVWVFGLQSALEDISSKPNVTVQRANIAVPPKGYVLPAGYADAPKAEAYSPDGGWLAWAPTEGRLLLFDLARYSGPIAWFGNKSHSDQGDANKRVGSQWESVHFAKNPDRLVAKLSSGEMQQWRYFDDENDLLLFVKDHLPFRDGSRITPDANCLAGVRSNINPALQSSCK